MTAEQIAEYIAANATVIAKGRALPANAGWAPPSQAVVNACAAILAPWQQPQAAAA